MNTVNPYSPPQAYVKDVAAPGTAAEPAGRGARLVASTLDGLFFAALVYIPLIIAMRMNGRPLLINGHFNSMAIAGSWTWMAVAGFVVWLWLTILFVARNGQSIAKKMLGIKVVRRDGSPASLGRIFLLRNIVNIVLSIVPFYSVVDSLLIFGEARQCLHDKIADTIVIKAKA